MKDNEIIEKRYQILVESDDLITICTPDRIRKFVNQSYCNFAGKPASELIGRAISEGFTPQKKLTYSQLTQTITVNNPSFNMLTQSGAPGSEKWIRWSENGIFDSQGNLIEVLSIGKNVDEFILAKKQHQDINAVLAAYQQAIDSNVICSITDVNGQIIYANQLFCDVSGYSAGELVGKSHNIVNSGLHDADFFHNMWSTIRAGKMWHGEIRNKAKDGSFYWVKTVIIPIAGAENELTNFLSLRVIITEKMLLEEERSRHLSALEDLLHMVSHELRKPIANCIGLLNIAKSHNLTEIEMAEILENLLVSAYELDMYSQKMNDYLHNTKHSNRLLHKSV
jgi:PAS domain S-box-containing protein